MGTLDIALHLLDGHLSAGHWISQTWVSSSIKTENSWEAQKEYPLCQFTVTYRVNHLLSLNDETQKMSNKQYVLPSPTVCLMLSATPFCLALPCEQNRWLLRAGNNLHLQWGINWKRDDVWCVYWVPILCKLWSTPIRSTNNLEILLLALNQSTDLGRNGYLKLKRKDQTFSFCLLLKLHILTRDWMPY